MLSVVQVFKGYFLLCKLGRFIHTHTHTHTHTPTVGKEYLCKEAQLSQLTTKALWRKDGGENTTHTLVVLSLKGQHGEELIQG